jgi:hypothetical protein
VLRTVWRRPALRIGLSDLEGGHADRTFKMPNPNYFLP